MVGLALGGVVQLFLLLAAVDVPVGAPALAAKPAAAQTRERKMVLFYTAEVHGVVEPCGCTSDPLGDVSRLTALIADTRRKGEAVALVDAGGLLYPEGTISPKERPSADARGEFLGAELTRVGVLGAAIGETDLARGVDHLGPPRLASNISGAPASAVRTPRVERVGEIRVGVVGVAEQQVAETVAAALHGRVMDMVPSVKADIDRLRAGGAELVVLLAPVDKVMARRLGREAGADIVVLGKRVTRGMNKPESIGRAFLVAPQDEIQQVGRLEIVLRTPPPTGTAAPRLLALTDAGGAEGNRLRLEEIDRSLARLRAGLREWSQASPGGGGASGANASAATDVTDKRFVAQKRQEVADLEVEQRRLQAPWQAPRDGNYLVNALIPMRRRLRQDPITLAGMKKLDRRIASINLANASPPPPAEAGRAFFVGTRKCAACHASAQTFWNKTVHAQAWKTLVDGGKQSDYKCTGCHVTGFGQVGGSSLGFTRNLESVQCETCHGPGSLHVAGEGNEEPLAIRRDTPETVCLGCHTEQHSDTFQFEAYLRDIVGPGHGAKRRLALGAGATGHELRSAALRRAKLSAATAPPVSISAGAAGPSP
jgi:hypothetical protein